VADLGQESGQALGRGGDVVGRAGLGQGAGEQLGAHGAAAGGLGQQGGREMQAHGLAPDLTKATSADQPPSA
jgi:hypothetical protein